MSGRHSLSLGIWINVGGRYESEEYKGISHFLEHLVFKGTKKYSCQKLKESIEGIGGSLNGFTSEELTCFLVKIPARYFERALDVLSSMVIDPTLHCNDIEREKTVVIEEIKMYKDLPQSYCHELLDELLWPGQPLGSPIIGSVDSVNRITRPVLDSFRSRFYTPSNIVVSAAGSLGHKRLADLAGKIFSKDNAQYINTFARAKAGQSEPQLKMMQKDTEQTHMALGFRALERDHPLKHALAMLHIILGANMSSRLFNEIREKRGLAYEIGTLVKRFNDTGSFVVHAGIDNRKVAEAIELILEEFRKIKSELASVDEFRRAREFYLGQVALALEDTMDQMLWIGESTAALDKFYTLQGIIKEVNKVKRADLKSLAQLIFREENLNLALIGPVGESQAEIHKQLQIG